MIKVWNYIKEFEKEKEETLAAVNTVLSSGCLVFGEHLEAFEKQFSQYCDSERGIGVGNCTDAIFIALKTLDVGNGDEVITVSNTAAPTVAAIHATGALTKFVDIREDNYLMDLSKLEAVITEKTKCIVVVHLYGQCLNMDYLNAIIKDKDIFVLEDCAQAHGATFKNKKAGSLSDISAFSFYPTKVLGAYGDGGMIVTSNHSFADRAAKLRFYGMERKKMSSGHWNGKYYSTEHGYNSRLDELHAAILLKKLSHIDEYILMRRKIAKFYEENLKETSFILPKVDPLNTHVFYVYVVRHPKRDFIIEKLKENDIHVNISYPWPIHLMEGYSSLDYKKGDLPITEKISQEIFSLPMYPTLSEDEQRKVVNVLKTIDSNYL